MGSYAFNIDTLCIAKAYFVSFGLVIIPFVSRYRFIFVRVFSLSAFGHFFVYLFVILGVVCLFNITKIHSTPRYMYCEELVCALVTVQFPCSDLSNPFSMRSTLIDFKVLKIV